MDSDAAATFDRRPMQVTAIGNARVLTEKGYATCKMRRKVSENQHLLLSSGHCVEFSVLSFPLIPFLSLIRCAPFRPT